MATPPTIGPALRSDHPGTDRPRWSIVIPVHNCADLLTESLGSVLNQIGDRTDAEFVVIDDGSSDRPERTIEALDANGVVRFERNDEAIGAVPNFNRCLRHSRGELVHLLHGDDYVLEGFYAAMDAAFDDPNVIAALCRTRYVDANGAPGDTTRSERVGTGVWESAPRTLAISNRVRPASIVVRRSVYERVGGFREDLPHAADWEMWMRLATSGAMWFIDEALACYRVHDSSDTAGRVRSGDNVRERRVAIGVISDLLPAGDRRASRRKALLYASAFACRTAAGRLGRRDYGAAIAQLREALICVVNAFALFVPSRLMPRRGRMTE